MSQESEIRERIFTISRYIVKTQSTVRDAAKFFNISKSTVYNDVTERLISMDWKLAEEVRAVLDFNKAERHIRGGASTKRKYSGRPRTKGA